MSKQYPTRFIILQEKPNPSTDYFVLPWIKEQIEQIGGAGTPGQEGKLNLTGRPKEAPEINDATECGETNVISGSIGTTLALPVHRFTWHQDLPPHLLNGAFVVIVRYLTSDWRRTLELHRDSLQSLAYFFDDDIPDIRAGQGLPLKYRLKLYRYGARHFDWLNKQTAHLFVSTPYLQAKYGSHNPTLLTPRQLSLQPSLPPPQTLPGHQEVQTPSPQTKRRCRVFYHATASHRKEIEWLYPVMKEVLDTSPDIEFEIVGDKKTRALYSDLPRTTIVDPMSWEKYQGFIAQPGRDIGLAPHLDSPFNRARSYTKLFDIERAGAIAIVADKGPWADALAQQELRSELHDDCWSRCLVVPMRQDSWVKTILQLVEQRLAK